MRHTPMMSQEDNHPDPLSHVPRMDPKDWIPDDEYEEEGIFRVLEQLRKEREEANKP